MTKITRNRFDKWQPAEVEYLVANWEAMSRMEIAEAMKSITVGFVRSYCAIATKAKELKLKKSSATRSRLAKIYNTGQFIAGLRPANDIAIGAISVRSPTNGAPSKWIKLGDKNWLQYHHYVWQQAGFTIPEKYVLKFKDADPLNCDLSNLELALRGPHSMKPDVAARASKRRALRTAVKEKRKAEKLAEKEKRIQAAKDKKTAQKLDAKNKRRATRVPAVTEQPKAVKPIKQKIKATFLTEVDKEKLKLERAAIRKLKSEKQLIAPENKTSQQRAKEIFKARKRKKEFEEQKERPPVLKLSPPNLTGKVPVKIGNMTVYVSPGADIDAIRAKYENRHKLSDKDNRLHNQSKNQALKGLD